jgi:hypothetical protein
MLRTRPWRGTSSRSSIDAISSASSAGTLISKRPSLDDKLTVVMATNTSTNETFGRWVRHSLAAVEATNFQTAGQHVALYHRELDGKKSYRSQLGSLRGEIIEV